MGDSTMDRIKGKSMAECRAMDIEAERLCCENYRVQLAEATARVGEMQKAILKYHQAVFNQDLSAEAMDRKAKTRHALFLLLHDNDL